MDNGEEFTGKAMLIRTYRTNVALRFIELGKPNQNAFIKSFNDWLRDESLNDRWFTSLAPASVAIAA